MATDYDAPRGRGDEDDDADSIEELRAAGASRAEQNPLVEDDDAGAEAHTLPGADLSDESLVISVVPQSEDEFTCSSCFLVFGNGARSAAESTVCRDCA